MMREMGLAVSPAGSEEVVTPEDEWKAAHGYWSDLEMPTSPTHQGDDEE